MITASHLRATGHTENEATSKMTSYVIFVQRPTLYLIWKRCALFSNPIWWET